MVELLVSVALMSVMTAVLLQSFIVARRLNARASTEQRLQTLAKSTMESVRAADISESLLKTLADDGRNIVIDGMSFQVLNTDAGYRLLYNDIGNGRGPVVSFGNQYGVYCDLDGSAYSDRPRALGESGGDLVRSYNRWERSGGAAERRLVAVSVVVYKMEEHLAKDGPEQLRLETARFIGAGGSS